MGAWVNDNDEKGQLAEFETGEEDEELQEDKNVEEGEEAQDDEEEVQNGKNEEESEEKEKKGEDEREPDDEDGRWKTDSEQEESRVRSEEKEKQDVGRTRGKENLDKTKGKRRMWAAISICWGGKHFLLFLKFNFSFVRQKTPVSLGSRATLMKLQPTMPPSSGSTKLSQRWNTLKSFAVVFFIGDWCRLPHYVIIIFITFFYLFYRRLRSFSFWFLQRRSTEIQKNWLNM